MPPTRFTPPKPSRTKLSMALETLGKLKERHPQWMNLSLSSLARESVLYPHLLYNIQLDALLQGKPLSATLKKVAWMYFLRDRKQQLGCAEVSIVSGRHKNVRLSEGLFVRKALQLIERSVHDRRIGRRRYVLRSVRLDSIHVFCLWLKVDRSVEYFIPVTSSSTVLRAGEWISRREFTKALRSEGQRVRAAQERMSRLLNAHQG
jgi:hypothetical protein